MGCVRCGRRQVDPVSGASPWRRAVLDGEQVLVCPDCQVEGWTEGLDACGSCGSTALAKRLGEVVCGDCGWSAAPDPSAGGGRRTPEREALADDVAAAVERVLGRG